MRLYFRGCANPMEHQVSEMSVAKQSWVCLSRCVGVRTRAAVDRCTSYPYWSWILCVKSKPPLIWPRPPYNGRDFTCKIPNISRIFSRSPRFYLIGSHEPRSFRFRAPHCREEVRNRVSHVSASPNCGITGITTQLFVADMPPIPKIAASTSKSPYAWTTGNKRSITHVEAIGNGGFGEVHKVRV